MACDEKSIHPIDETVNRKYLRETYQKKNRENNYLENNTFKMSKLPVRKTRNFSFTPSKPHKQQRIREYILYCCPTGHFSDQLERFWDKSRGICGFNGVHNFIPHITLVSFFKAHEDSEPSLVEAVRSVAEDGKYLNQPLTMELYTSSNFIGLFINENDENILKRIALNFVKDISETIISDTVDLDSLIACFPYCASTVNEKTSSSRCIPKSSRSISLEPHVKNLHLTLAYQFPSEAYHDLAELVEQLDLTKANSWELRLYSRDPRLATKQVNKVIYPHTSRELDELELRVGDYIYINSDAAQNSADGWAEGISFSTNNLGFFPLNYTERTSETNVWTLNETVNLCQDVNDGNDAVDGVSHTTESDIFQNENRSFSQSEMIENDTQSMGQKRRVIILRHGERVDFVFGNQWTTFTFNDSNQYVRMDLNMPENLPPRATEDWEKDSPLTTLGAFQSQLVGSSLKSFGMKFSNVFASPSYRCIQTANEVLSAMSLENELPINVEYGLFEWCGWYERGLPNWLCEKELGVIYNINENYQPVIEANYLETCMKESLEELYNRNSKTLREIVKNCDGDILIVSHALNLETCTRQLIGKEPRTSRTDMRNLLMRIPFLAAVALQETDDGNFQLIEPPCLTLTHNSCTKFDWRILDDN